MSDVLFKKPDGSFVKVDSKEALQAQEMGYEPTTPEAMAASKQTLAAGAEGIGRGATLGMTDLLGQAYGITTAKEQHARRQENPWAAGAGEVAGAVATSALTGGGIARAAGGGLKGMTIESGVYGMGSMITESALENKELTSEHLAAGFLGGAGVGLGAGLGFKAISKGVSAGMSKFGGKGLQDTLHEAAFTLEERQLAQGNKGLLKKLEKRGGSLRDVVKYAKDEGIPVEFTDKAVEGTRAALAKTGETTAGLMSKLDDVSPLNTPEARDALLGKVRQQVTGKFKGDIVAEKEVKSFLAEHIDPLMARENLTYPELYKLQSRLRGAIEGGSSSVKKEVWDTGRRALRDTIFAEAEAINPGVQAQLHSLQTQYAKGAFLEDALSNGLQSTKAVGGISGTGLMDTLRGGGMGGTIGATIAGPVGAPIGALVGAYANKALRERGGSMAASALRSIADSGVTKGISDALSGHLTGILKAAPAILGAYRYPLAVAAAKGADELMQEHIRLASGANGQDYMAKVGLTNETPGQVDAAGQRLAVLDSIQRAQVQHDIEMNSAIDGLFGSAKGRKGSVGGSMSVKEFAAKSAAIRQVVERPELVHEQLTAQLASGAPATTAMAAAKIVQANQYLDSKMPKSPYAGVPDSVRPDWNPSPADIDRFNRYREAVESPAKALKNMAQGHISQEQIDAIKAVYPTMYSELQQKITERLAQAKKPLSYQQKLAVMAIVGPSAVGMSPQQAQMLQMAHAQGPSQGAPPSAKKDGRQEVNASKNQQTQAQRLEAR